MAGPTFLFSIFHIFHIQHFILSVFLKISPKDKVRSVKFFHILFKDIEYYSFLQLLEGGTHKAVLFSADVL